MFIKRSYGNYIGKDHPDTVSDFFNPSNNYDTLVPQKQTNEDYAYDSGYGSSTISPVEEEEDKFTVIDGDPDFIPFSEESDDLIILSSKSYNAKNILDYDIRYSDFIKKAKDLYVYRNYKSINDYKNILENFKENCGKNACIYIKTNEDNYHNISKIAVDLDLSQETLRKETQRILKIKRSSFNKCSTTIKTASGSFTFNCDVAEDFSEKTKGLQGRDYLKVNHGMVFPYDKKSNLLFHMGTVKFAIDIIFAEEGKIRKVYSNIQPDSLGTYGCYNSDLVLEIPGGFCEANNISEGDVVKLGKYSGLDNDILHHDVFNSALAVKLEEIVDLDSVSLKQGNLKINGPSCLIKNISNGKLDQKFSFATRKMHKDILGDSNFEKVIVYFDGSYDLNSVNILCKQAFNNMGFYNLEYDIIRTSSYFSHKDIHNAIKNKFYCDKVWFNSQELSKVAGFTIEKEIKNIAISVIKKYEINLKNINHFKNDLEKNKKAYEKVKDKFNIIKNSKGKYKKSTQRLSKKYKRILNSLKECIEYMQKIKDVQAVEEINGTIISSARNASDNIKKIFKLVDSLDKPEFFQDLTKATDDAIKIIDDLVLNIKRMREFIYSNILGKTIISE